MSALFPLYLLGLGAIAAPIVFHLIRRLPRSEVPFSSLMFLAATPPRLTRRSRLDQWLLLCLRAAALALLAFAFARPFFRQAAHIDLGDRPNRRIAVLIDSSASMRRGDVWSKARALARQALDDCRPSDQLAVFAFDRSSRPLLGFEESARIDPVKRAALAQNAVDQLQPSWGATDLGQALRDVVTAIEDVADSSEKAGEMPRRIVLISDLAQGSRLDALGEFTWPSDVDLEIKSVSADGANAGLERLSDATEGEPAGALPVRRVRIVNSGGSVCDRFTLDWVGDNGAPAGKPLDVYVPPGESRVVRVPAPPAGALWPSLLLKGDAHSFDNTLYFVDEPPRDVTVLYIGSDRADDPQGLLYYLERVFVPTARQKVQVAVQKPGEPVKLNPETDPRLIILTAETPLNQSDLARYLDRGGTVLAVVAAAGRAETLATLAGVAPFEFKEAAMSRDVMLGEIAFDHPIFAPLAAAQFNDFTKIHFWKYRRIDTSVFPDARVVARFENQDPALVEKPVGKGRLFVLASGWNTADSQLARSSKFVPLMAGLIDPGDGAKMLAANLKVGDRVPLPPRDRATRNTMIRKPDGTSEPIGPTTAFFDATDLPGVYTLELPGGPLSFAVNLDPLESKTNPMGAESIEQRGVHLAQKAKKEVNPEERRQLHNEELESRQQIWRWLILAVIGILLLETWLAGRTANRSGPVRAEVTTL